MDENPDRETSRNELDNDDYPAFSMGRAVDTLGVTAAFLRSLDDMGLVVAQRSPGGHRRYSRNQLRLVSRVRELVSNGTAVEAACRIVSLEEQLADARRDLRDRTADDRS
ncbi:MerR family transcriptional regulator [Rhodococcus sp. IEGM 1307]|uniref:helix-turn-helix domain-containing protein n=1 Tax=Rhodococcus sp. IEGM 1307 TaxID=3047091 RepID=UPI0024B67AF7|nr:MerR family transcriptional regulator [Rhodococcus sp. IEGM 1307]MDI9973771.1 MerR family transcriptional regulator [Rhodococcus sp. IEGM 1307]